MPSRPRFRLRLSHQLALLQAGTVVVALAAVTGVVSWNLRTGFADYLREQDRERLDQFAHFAGSQVEARGLASLRGPPAVLRELVEATLEARGEHPALPPPPPQAAPDDGPAVDDGRPPTGTDRDSGASPRADREDRPPPAAGTDGRPSPGFDREGRPLAADPEGRPLPGAAADVRPPPRFDRDGQPLAADRAGRPPPASDRPVPDAARDRRPPPDPASFGARLAIADAAGQPLSGRVPPAGEAELVQAIQAHGATVAWAHLHERPPATRGVEARFLRRQYLGLGGVAVGSLALALLAAWLAARRWVRPIADAQAATRRISEGAFDVRLARRGDDEWSDLADDVNRMAAALQRLEASRRRWIAELSHELRTPLAVLRAEIDSLRDGIRAPDAAALASLQAEVRRLTRLTDDFHELALSDLRALPVAPEPVDAAALLADLAARFLPRAQAAGLALVLADTAVLGAAPVRWDAQRIEQLLAALLENSLRYTDAPGRIEIACAARGDELEIRVDDSPPGVPETEFERLFDPLFRLDGSRSRHSGGSGLGLAIARAIAASHGGRIAARRSPLGGLGITVTLPRMAVVQEALR